VLYPQKKRGFRKGGVAPFVGRGLERGTVGAPSGFRKGGVAPFVGRGLERGTVGAPS